MHSVSERQLFIMLIAVSAVVSAVFGTLICFDSRDIAGKEKRIAEIEGDIRSLGWKARLAASLRMEIDALSVLEVKYRKALPAARQDDGLLKAIQQQATESGVILKSCAFAEDRASGPQSASDPWRSFDIDLEASGRFFHLLDFINRVEHYPRIVSVVSGRFAVLQGSPMDIDPPCPDEEDRPAGPQLTMGLRLSSFTIQAPSVAMQGAPAPTGGGLEIELQDWPEAAVLVPDEAKIRLVDRRDPFCVQLRRKPPAPSGGAAGEASGEHLQDLEAAKKLEEWVARFEDLFAGPTGRNLIREWRALVEEVENASFLGDEEKSRTILLENLKKMGKQVREALEAMFEEECRTSLEDLEGLLQSDDFPGVLARYRRLLDGMFCMDRFPSRAHAELQACTHVYLAALQSMVREKNDFVSAIAEVDENLVPMLPARWSGDSFVRDLAGKARAIRGEAQSLVEFHGFGILVSGIVWLPDASGSTARRVAIVNDSAVQEGEAVPAGRVSRAIPGAPARPAPATPITLKEVGRDRYVWFEYKGLCIRCPLGNGDPARTGSK